MPRYNRRMQSRTLPIIPLLLALATAGNAQDVHVGKSCDLDAAGGSDEASFLRFDWELRGALSKKDLSALALLVSFPLRVNDGERGSYSLNDPTALQARFAEIFTPETISSVIKQRTEDIFCSYRGIMYGNGRVWAGVTYRRYTVNVINVTRDRQPSTAQGNRKLVFACNAEKHRVLVDEDAKGSPRYRAWTKPHSVLDTPDLEIQGGKASIEGTGSCAYQLWTFKNRVGGISVSKGLGCYEDVVSIPVGVTGMLSIGAETGEGDGQSSFCF